MPRDAVSRTANVGTVGKNGLMQAWKTCNHSLRMVAKIMGKMFKINGVVGKSDIFLYSIASKLVGGFFYKTNIMCQILSRSDLLKKKRLVKKRYSSMYLLMKNIDI